MKYRLLAAGAALLAIGMAASHAQAVDATPQANKHVTTKKAVKAHRSTLEDEIQALRSDLESQKAQIESLKSDLAEKSERLTKAEQAVGSAKSEAVKAEAAASAQQNAAQENATAVAALGSAVTGVKTEQSALSAIVSTETAKIKKSIESPAALHYKGIVLTPMGFLVGDTAYRSHGTGAELATPFSTIPYEHADAYSLSEFFGSGRQSRIGVLAEGKLSWGAIRGYYEADFLGSGTTSNENQSNSYVLRQRLLYAEAETNTHWAFTSGQMWSLITENKQGISAAASNMALPPTIDPNYLPGFIWTRQYGFHVVKNFSKAAVGVAVENPQILYTASLAGNTPYAVLGSAGVNGGLMNAAMSSCSPSTSIVNYTNQTGTGTGGQTVNVALPVYKTLNSCANLANLTFNQAPDLLAKAAFDPGFGHFEVFGVVRFAHETVYPGETTNGNLYGGLKDIVTGATVAPALTTAGAFSNSIMLGGGGASARVPLIQKKLSLGAKGLYGAGVGRYDDTTLPDTTANAWGGLAPLHNLSGLLTAEVAPNPRFSVWLNYGGDYAGRTYYSGGTSLGAPTAAQNASGVWGGHWSAPAAAAVGYGSPLLSNAACQTDANPGYTGSSTGYYAGASCGAQTRNVQEMTGGYWYDIYKGDRGRLRQGVQYGYLVREAWSGANGIGAKGIENMVFTTFRYYLP